MKPKHLLLISALAFSACTGQVQQKGEDGATPPPPTTQAQTSYEIVNLFPEGYVDDAFIHEGQVARHVRRIYQDTQGNLWIGSNAYGLMRHDGDTLVYFNTNAIRAIHEDDSGNVWFASGGGLVKYTPSTTAGMEGLFKTYTTADGLVDDDLWALTLDRKGTYWIGTANGVSKFDPTTEDFTTFEIPEVDMPEASSGYSEGRIACIAEDNEGNLWMGTDGFGMWKWDGTDFSHITADDGLAGNYVSDIHQHSNGLIWVATMFGGVCRMDPATYEDFGIYEYELIGTKELPNGAEVWNIYEARNGDIWFPTEGPGLFRYDGTTLHNYNEAEGIMAHAMQCFHEDRQGRFWVGGWTGLYRYDPSTRDQRGGKDFYPVGRFDSWD